MKIAFVCPHFYPHIGGVETVVLQLATNLAKKGNDVTVLTQNLGNQLPSKSKINNFVVLRFNTVGIGDLMVSFELLKYLRKNSHKFDVIHSHNYHSFPALAVALTKKTLVVFSPHYHGTGHSKFTQILHYPYQIIGEYIFSNCEAILCDTDAEAELVKKHFHNFKKISVMPLGIDVQGIQKTNRNINSPAYILSVGRLENYKNVSLTIRALQFMNKNITLKIVGDGTQKMELQTMADKLNLSDRITFANNVAMKDLFALLRNAKVFVTMSTMEAYGLSLLEAVAAGIGVVASDIPAHKELVEKFNIKNVFLLNPRSSPKALARSLSIAMISPSAAPKLPSWNYVSQQTWKHYKNAINL